MQHPRANTPGTSETVIAVDRLVKHYGVTRAVDDVSFTVQAGEIFGLLGPNGAGKTTILSCLEGLVRPDTGAIRVLGIDGVADAVQVKQKIGVQLQRTTLLENLTASEQVQLFARLYGIRLDRADTRKLLARVGLGEQADGLAEKLSGGQQQRLALALALVNEPEILFLDEPTTGLDPLARRLVWELVRSLAASGRTVMLTTHSMEEAERLCSRIAIVDRGRLLALDTPPALIARLGRRAVLITAAPLEIGALDGLPGVERIHREGAAWHIESAEWMASLVALQTLAGQTGVPLDDLYIQRPTLEDVFLQLTTGRVPR